MNHLHKNKISELQNLIWKTAVEICGVLRKIAVPVIFTAVFYLFVGILGNQSLCIFYTLYGVPCPGCGLTRSYLHLFRGDIPGAFYFHPLFLLPAAIVFVLVFQNAGFLRKLRRSNSFWLVVTAVFVGVWIVRMILMFPDREPMNFNSRALLPKFFSMLFGK